MSIYNQGSPGLGNVASYQVSGKPFATGSLTAPAVGGTPVKVEFPSVTKWVKIYPITGSTGDATYIRAGFSSLGVQNNNYFRIFVGGLDAGGMPASATPDPDPLELKVTELYFMSDSAQTIDFDVVAGLTGIDERNITNNWSGSDGVG